MEEVGIGEVMCGKRMEKKHIREGSGTGGGRTGGAWLCQILCQAMRPDMGLRDSALAK